MTDLEPDWMRPVREAWQELLPGRCLVVKVPVYRPDLARQMAASLGMVFRDFRAEYLKKQGNQAERVSLEALDRWVVSCVEQASCLIHNAEALLACHAPEKRIAWFSSLARREWPNRWLLPLYLFGGELGGDAPASVALDYEKLPEQGLISRLLNT